jgi:hypothetical protein
MYVHSIPLLVILTQQDAKNKNKNYFSPNFPHSREHLAGNKVGKTVKLGDYSE